MPNEQLSSPGQTPGYVHNYLLKRSHVEHTKCVCVCVWGGHTLSTLSHLHARIADLFNIFKVKIFALWKCCWEIL